MGQCSTCRTEFQASGNPMTRKACKQCMARLACFINDNIASTQSLPWRCKQLAKLPSPRARHYHARAYNQHMPCLARCRPGSSSRRKLEAACIQTSDAIWEKGRVNAWRASASSLQIEQWKFKGVPVCRWSCHCSSGAHFKTGIWLCKGSKL